MQSSLHSGAILDKMPVDKLASRIDTASHPRPPRHGQLVTMGVAALLHGALLLLVLREAPVSLALKSVGQPVSGTGITVTLVAAVSPPTPVPPVPIQPAQPKHSVAVRKTQVLTSRVPDATGDLPVPIADTHPAPTSVFAAPQITQSAPAPVSHELNLPGANTSKEVRHIGCHIPEPVYPPGAKRMGQEGSVLLHVTVDVNGQMERADIATSSGNADLDAAAVSAVMQGHCQPYIENGQALRISAMQPINFHLDR